jgi:hypothetical protein
MTRPRKKGAVLLVAVGLALGAAASAMAQAKPQGWGATANLSGVLTSGNADTTSGAVKAHLEYNWLRTYFNLDGGALWAASKQAQQNGLPDFYAVGPKVPDLTSCQGSCAITDNREMKSTAQNYFGEIGLERRITERFYFTVGGGYLRDLFSGVERKVDGRAGVGYIFMQPNSWEFKTAILATYTDQQEKVPDPTTKEQYAGLRGLLDFGAKFGERKQNAFTSKLAVDENLQVTQDLRTTWDNALTVSMTDRLALQLGAKLAYRNLPALREVPLYAPGSVGAPNSQPIGKVTTPYEKLDSQFTVALVVNWKPRPPSQARPTQ